MSFPQASRPPAEAPIPTTGKSLEPLGGRRRPGSFGTVSMTPSLLLPRWIGRFSN